MTDKEADEWLKCAMVRWATAVHDKAAIANIQRRLARPVLPEEPTDAMLDAMDSAWSRSYNHAHVIRDIYCALYAHLAQPSTKWRVTTIGGGNNQTCATADQAANAVKKWLEDGFAVRAEKAHSTKTIWQVVATGGPDALKLEKCPTACAAAEEARQWLEEGYNVRIDKAEVPND